MFTRGDALMSRTLLKLTGFLLMSIGVFGVLASLFKRASSPGGFFCLYTLGMTMVLYTNKKVE